MKILVDADSCPRPVRELVLRRANKLNIKIIFAANRLIPDSQGAIMELCPEGDDAADDRIVELAEKDDFVITRDVPLAKRLVEKEVLVIDDRGRVITANNINEYLSIRNFTVGLADSGLEIVRNAGFDKKVLKTFADSLDRILTKYTKKNQ